MEVSAWSSAASALPDGWSSALILAAVAVATALLWRCDFFGDAWRFFVLFNVSLHALPLPHAHSWSWRTGQRKGSAYSQHER